MPSFQFTQFHGESNQKQTGHMLLGQGCNHHGEENGTLDDKTDASRQCTIIGMGSFVLSFYGGSPYLYDAACGLPALQIRAVGLLLVAQKKAVLGTIA